MTKLDYALRLAAMGFPLFPVKALAKTPAHKGWQQEATTDESKLRAWFTDTAYNIGVYTENHLVIDVDNKGEKNGDLELLQLEFAGCDFPRTLECTTPTGGRHLVYKVSTPVRQGANVLGPGLDTRGAGGYIVGPGSRVQAGQYTCAFAHPVAPAPEWLVERLGRPLERAVGSLVSAATLAPSGIDRARHYLLNEAPLAVQGAGGDETTFKVACRVKDFGVSPADACTLMSEHWNPRCEPPWDPVDLDTKIGNAYGYGKHPIGVAAPEAAFPPVQESPLLTNREQAQEVGKVLHPFDILNRTHAFVVAGGGSHILWETVDANGKPTLEHLATSTFHQKYASWMINTGKRDEPVTQEWMKSKRRRDYDGMCFRPEQPSPDRFYNLWRGFAFTPQGDDEPATQQAKDSLDDFLGHTLSNVCNGDDVLARWLVGYFAHIVQRPFEKPLVALVFRGAKGVGKNALIERVGGLLGNHFTLTSNRRYLISQFNGHLEKCLLFALDEAFWSGDKQSEGILKDLITGQQHVIEHKGKEPYTVENRTRIAIIGNEDWLVPASADERRFAVFDVGSGRKQDRAFFEGMRKGMEAGGYRLLLRHLQRFDLAGHDINGAPNTQGLADQKTASLDGFGRWWLDCLHDGRILGSDFETPWPGQADTVRTREAFRRYCREQRITGWLPDNTAFGKALKKVCPNAHPSKRRDGNGFVNTYKLPSLDECRELWEQYIGHPVEWVKEEQ